MLERRAGNPVNDTNGAAAEARSRAIRRVLFVTLGLNLAVATAKVLYGWWAGSLSIRADGFHSAADALNNVVLLVGASLAAAPADREHRYGHQSHEVLAAGFVGVSLLLVAFDVARDVVARLSGGGAVPRIDAGAFVLLGGTLAVNLGIAAWESHLGKKLNSPGLISDAAHTRSDIVVTLGVLATAVLTKAGWLWIDAATGALIAAFVAITGLRVVRQNARYLVDTNLVDEHRVIAIVRQVSGVLEAGDVRSRGTPGAVFVDLKVAVDGGLPVEAAHDLSHRIEDRVRASMPDVIAVSIHVEPHHPTA